MDTQESNSDFLYRFEEELRYERLGRVVVKERKYKIVRRTPCGYWIKLFDIFDNERWVSSNGKKRFAYPTRYEAMINFKARKNRQIKILKGQLDNTEQALHYFHEDIKDKLRLSVDIEKMMFHGGFMEKELLFSVTKKDFKIQTFRSGGPGGQHQNKTDSGVRIIHKESGAKGESRNFKSQHQNKKYALQRLTETKNFKLWITKRFYEVIDGKTIEKKVEEQLDPKNLKIEVKGSGGWEAI